MTFHERKAKKDRRKAERAARPTRKVREARRLQKSIDRALAEPRLLATVAQVDKAGAATAGEIMAHMETFLRERQRREIDPLEGFDLEHFGIQEIQTGAGRSVLALMDRKGSLVILRGDK